MLQIFLRRDKSPQEHGIKEMTEPSKEELLERARKSLRIAVRRCASVSTQLAAIKERKKSGRLEHGRNEEIVTLDFPDLILLIMDTGSRVIDVGYEKENWNLLIQGTTSLGVSLQVWVRLSKQEDLPLLITDFQIPQP